MNPNKANIVDFQVENIFPITIEAHRNPIGFTEESPRVALETQVIITGVSSWQVTLSGKVIFVTKPEPFDITVVMVGLFAMTDHALDIQSFLQETNANTLAILIPFVREAILEMSVRMRLPPLLFPTLDLNITEITGQKPTDEQNIPASNLPHSEQRPNRVRREKNVPAE